MSSRLLSEAAARRWAEPVLLASLVALASCRTTSATAPDHLKPQGADKAFGGTQCASYQAPTEPDLLGWDSASRARLGTLREQGLVAVRYHAEGCNVELEVLNCVAKKGAYAFRPTYAEKSKVLKSDRDLFAELPIGASKLTGKVSGGRALRADYTLAGTLSVPVDTAVTPSDLKGPDCARATHVVGTLYVGGFAMESGEREAIEARASLFGAGLGGGQARSAGLVERDGSPVACGESKASKQLVAQCDVPLRVGLLPIAGRQAATPITAGGAAGSCPAGMLRIPAGTFQMGSNESADEQPVHAVRVESFCMGRTEVTVAAYEACVLAGACTPAHNGQGCNWGVSGREQHPINCVDWNQADAYCKAQGQRLPTEEEWEYAARGIYGWTYPWGNEAPSNQLCWNGEGNDLGKGNRQSTCPVGAYPKGNSRLGLADMAGNVWEWTSSTSSSSYSEPRSSTSRVSRGGGWFNGSPRGVRSAIRRGADPGYRLRFLGFRCAGSSSASP